MKAGEVMTRNVVSIGTDASVADMVKLMFDNRISGLPVVDDQGGLVGIVTEGDCLRRAEIGTERKRPRWLELLIGPGRLADEYIHTHSRKVAEVMTQSPITITEDTSLEEVVDLMENLAASSGCPSCAMGKSWVLSVGRIWCTPSPAPPLISCPALPPMRRSASNL